MQSSLKLEEMRRELNGSLYKLGVGRCEFKTDYRLFKFVSTDIIAKLREHIDEVIQRIQHRFGNAVSV